MLNEGYLKQESFYEDFVNNKLNGNAKYFSEEAYYIDDLKPFPIYIPLSSNIKEEQQNQYLEAFNTFSECYLKLDRELLFSQRFWHSLFLLEFREYLVDLYPEILVSKSKFNNIVLKQLNWENYIYKIILGSQYINECVEEQQRDHYYKLIVHNMDMYNYVIKTRILRNDMFLKNVLDIIDNNNLSKTLKAFIKDRPDLGKDPRYGRMVIFEFNKSYPVVLSPMMDYRSLEEKFIEYLKIYWKGQL